MQSTIQPTKQDYEKSSKGEGWSLKPMGKGTKFERGRELGNIGGGLLKIGCRNPLPNMHIDSRSIKYGF